MTKHLVQVVVQEDGVNYRKTQGNAGRVIEPGVSPAQSAWKQEEGADLRH